MSIFQELSNTKRSAITQPAIARIIEVSWVRDEALRLDVDCIRQKRDRVSDGVENVRFANDQRTRTHQFFPN
jgi:hypothetical protein